MTAIAIPYAEEKSPAGTARYDECHLGHEATGSREKPYRPPGHRP
ncbi:hypothetical protein [Streptomyces sp. NPDC092129]